MQAFRPCYESSDIMKSSCEISAGMFETCKVALDAYRDAVHAVASTQAERRELEPAMNTARQTWEKCRAILEDHQLEHGCRPFFISAQE
jgi:hypothetical protein